MRSISSRRRSPATGVTSGFGHMERLGRSSRKVRAQTLTILPGRSERLSASVNEGEP